MPTYEYACPTCGIVEFFQSIKESALTTCPACKQQKVTRMISAGGAVIFKGSGFWETDYNRSAEYRKKASSEAKPSEAKPAKTPDTSAGKDSAKPPTATAPAASESQSKPQMKQADPGATSKIRPSRNGGDRQR